MGHRLSVSSKLKPLGVGAAKASLNRAIELDALDPKPSDLGMSQVEGKVTLTGGPNPHLLKKIGMSLCLGVKGQSNSEIAGSPRNLFR